MIPQINKTLYATDGFTPNPKITINNPHVAPERISFRQDTKEQNEL